MTIGAIIEEARAGLAAELPSMLETAGQPDFSRYVTGYPDNQDETFCCVRFAAMNEGADNGSLEFIIHLALPGVAETDAYGYLEAARRYLDGVFDPAALGYDARTWESRVFDTDFTNGDIQALFSVTMSRQKDDCG
jgi:hypothetical protein